MKQTTFALLLAVSVCRAGSFSVIDAFGQPACPSGITVGCDAIAPATFADFYRADLNFGPTSGTINLYFNYGPPGHPNLSPFAATPGTALSVADLFLYSGASFYAIPLFNRTTALWGSASAGTAYLANSAAALLNSETVLNNPLDIDFRSGSPVWIDTTQAAVANVGSLVAITNSSIDGKTVDFAVTINLSYIAGSPFANAMNAPGLRIFTGTTTGATDLVPDRTAVPEPATWTMLGSAMLLAGLCKRRSCRSPYGR